MKGNKNIFVYNAIDDSFYTKKPIYKNNIQEQIDCAYMDDNELKYFDIIQEKNHECKALKYDIDQAWYWWQVERFQYPYY